jgi:hypothetical protein
MIPNKLTDFELIEFLTHFGERISQQVIAQLYKQAFAGRDATIPEIYKWNLVETSKFHLYFSGSCIPTNESLFILLALVYLHWHRQFTILPNC